MRCMLIATGSLCSELIVIGSMAGIYYEYYLVQGNLDGTRPKTINMTKGKQFTMAIQCPFAPAPLPHVGVSLLPVGMIQVSVSKPQM